MHRVRIGIWANGPVVYMDEETLGSFEERGMYLLYDQRNSPAFTMCADVLDRYIDFYQCPTNIPNPNHIILPRENDMRGWAAMINCQPSVRFHSVRAALHDATGYWAGDGHRFRVPVSAPHLLPYPPEAAMTTEQIIDDINERRRAALSLTGRRYVNLPSYYLRALTPEQRMVLSTSNARIEA